MLGCIQPMSSPMMNRMFGFFSWAAAGAASATADRPTAKTAAPTPPASRAATLHTFRLLIFIFSIPLLCETRRPRTVWSAHKRARGSSQHRPRSMLTAADAPLCSLSLASADSLLEVSISSSEPLHFSPCLPAYLQQGQHHHTITGPERSHLGHQQLYVYIRDTPFPSSIPSQDRPRFQPPCGTTLPNPRRSKPYS